MITQIEIQQAASAAESLKLLLDKTNPNRLKQGDEMIKYDCGEAWMLRSDLLRVVLQNKWQEKIVVPYIPLYGMVSNPFQVPTLGAVERYEDSGRPVIITNDLAVNIVNLAASIAQHNRALLHTMQEYEHRLRDAYQQHECCAAQAKEGRIAKERLQSLLSIRGVKKLAGRAGLLARWFKADCKGGTAQ